jgi:23S rRNA (adenine2030-N6)-methyltransferase
MRASGLVILNPPWQFDTDLEAAGAWLADALWPRGGGRHILRWLKPPADKGERER